RLDALARDANQAEWLESSCDEPCLVRVGCVEDGGLLAVASLQNWSDALGHIGVFTRADVRGRGRAVQVSAAIAHEASARGLIPQWRSSITNAASARVADRLGFVPLGRQFSVRVRPTST